VAAGGCGGAFGRACCAWWCAPERHADSRRVMRAATRRPADPPLRQVHWLRVVVDEGHSLGASLSLTNKLAMAVQLTAERRWIMTGTPTPATSAGVGAGHAHAGTRATALLHARAAACGAAAQLSQTLPLSRLRRRLWRRVPAAAAVLPAPGAVCLQQASGLRRQHWRGCGCASADDARGSHHAALRPCCRCCGGAVARCLLCAGRPGVRWWSGLWRRQQTEQGASQRAAQRARRRQRRLQQQQEQERTLPGPTCCPSGAAAS
jgi:hypothetical protein